jgi:hypothetical protein
MGRKRNMNRLVGKPLGRPRHRWVNNIKIDLVEMVWGGVALDRKKWRALVKAALNLHIP